MTKGFMTDISEAIPFDIAVSLYGFDPEQSVFLSEKLLSAAASLPEGTAIGLQIMPKEPRLLAFSSPGAAVTAEELEWLLGGFARPGGELCKAEDIFTGRRVCYLSPAEDEGCITGDAPRFDLLVETAAACGAALLIMAGKAGGESRGAMLLTMPEEPGLRLPVAASMAFPGGRFLETDGSEDVFALRGEAFIRSLGRLLPALVGRARRQEERLHREARELSVTEREEELEEFLAPAEDDDEYGHTPIEELELSVRTFNCLKRAGVYWVERLREMSDEELLAIRNLSRKCLHEIREKLGSCPAAAPDDGTDHMALLDELIGLEEVKAQVRRIAAFAKMRRAMAENGRESIHLSLNMEFVGSPGTAKTTVARIMAGILRQTGILPSGDIVEVGRADLVGKYTGHTADNVKNVFKRAKGKLLFIDEAYSLLEYWEGSFGDEAISTIVQEMENCREDTVVVFAGYPDKMAELFARNPGLRSRVPFVIGFRDYSAREMGRIVEAEARKRGFAIGPSARARLPELCAEASRDPEAGNGRFCRNLAESAILSYAERVFGGDGPCEPDFTLTAADFSRPFVPAGEKKPAPIGFAV